MLRLLLALLLLQSLLLFALLLLLALLQLLLFLQMTLHQLLRLLLMLLLQLLPAGCIGLRLQQLPMFLLLLLLSALPLLLLFGLQALLGLKVLALESRIRLSGRGWPRCLWQLIRVNGGRRPVVADRWHRTHRRDRRHRGGHAHRGITVDARLQLAYLAHAQGFAFIRPQRLHPSFERRCRRRGRHARHDRTCEQSGRRSGGSHPSAPEDSLLGWQLARSELAHGCTRQRSRVELSPIARNGQGTRECARRRHGDGT